jgi:hypothetical protein
MDGGNTIFLYRIHQLLNSIPNFVKIQDIQTQAAGKTPGHSILNYFDTSDLNIDYKYDIFI